MSGVVAEVAAWLDTGDQASSGGAMMFATDGNSQLVVDFLVDFSKLKRLIDDDVTVLVSEFKGSERLRRQVKAVNEAAFLLRSAEKGTIEPGAGPQDMFSRPTDPKFIKAWRDYELRFARTISELSSYFRQDPVDRPAPPLTQTQSWEQIRSEADELLDEFSDEISDQDTKAVEVFGHYVDFEKRIGFDVRGAYRRYLLIPFILVPRHVSSHYGENDRLSLFENLRQAHTAFIFGAPFAAIVLMRSVMEATLRNHYRIGEGDLSARINALREVPEGLSKSHLHELRLLANAIVHLEENDGLHVMIRDLSDAQAIEPLVVRALNALRLLLESAPTHESRSRG